MASLNEIQLNEDLATDTNQILYFHYIKGSAGLCEVKHRMNENLKNSMSYIQPGKWRRSKDICILKEMVCKDSPI